jgi:hypothetical protein
MNLTPPQATAVDVVAAQPTDADSALIARLDPAVRGDVAPAAYLILVLLQTVPPATSSGWALYVNDFRIPKYWEYKDGIYLRSMTPNSLPITPVSNCASHSTGPNSLRPVSR